MSKLPLVSILIPMYNAEKTIESALGSIQKQTYSNLEIICVNDGSDDATFSIVEHRANHDSRIKLYDHEHRGIVYICNKLIELSHGKYLARMDADDISHLNRIEKQVSYMESNPDIIASGCAWEEFDERGVFNTVTRPAKHEVLQFSQLRSTAIWHPTAIIRRSVLLNNNIRYNEKFTYIEDYKFFFDLSLVGRLGNIPDVLLTYRRHPAQISIKYGEKQLKLISELRPEIYKYLCKEHALNPETDKPREWRRKIPRDHDAIWTFLWYIVTQVTGLTKLRKLRLVLFTHLRLRSKPRLILSVFAKNLFMPYPV